MTEKFQFYQKYEVEEYYIYDPDRIKLTGYLRKGGKLTAILKMDGWVSPRLGVRFDMSGTELKLFGPDGQRFLTVQERDEKNDQLTEQNHQLTDQNHQLTDQNHQLASERDRLVAQLRALGIEPGV